MRSKVFISCGQREGELQIANEIASRLKDFDTHVAREVQSIQDINLGVIGKLRRTDYYVFVDFRREHLSGEGESAQFRGSLFSHQELGIACAFGIERAVFLRQNGVLLEGMGAFMASNAQPFERPEDVPGLVVHAFRSRDWRPDYSRNLVVKPPLIFPESLVPVGGYPRPLRPLHAHVFNYRPDYGAAGTVARLARIKLDGERSWRTSPNRSHLKVTAHPGFEKIIWPRSHDAFDLLLVDDERCLAYLHNALDVLSKPHLIDRPGVHLLGYEVFAQDFGIVRFVVELNLPGGGQHSTARIVDNGCDAP